jgi:hypothetical protein
MSEIEFQKSKPDRGTVAFAGTRSPSLELFEQTKSTACKAALFRFRVRVGCCTGYDAAVIDGLRNIGQENYLEVFAAFGSDGRGRCRTSNYPAVWSLSWFDKGSIRWWSGGDSLTPLRNRLAARTRNVVMGADGLVVGFGYNPKGTLLAAQIAVAYGIPLYALESSVKLHDPGLGHWVRVGDLGIGTCPGFLSAKHWVWTEAQGLFDNQNQLNNL